MRAVWKGRESKKRGETNPVSSKSINKAVRSCVTAHPSLIRRMQFYLAIPPGESGQMRVISPKHGHAQSPLRIPSFGTDAVRL